MKKVDRIIGILEDTISVALFFVLVAVIVWSVACRYILRVPFLQSEELARYLMLYIAFLSTSIAVKTNSHIGVDFLVQVLPARAKRYFEILTDIFCCLLFFLLFFLSVQYMQKLIATGQTTTTLANLPMYVIYACVPVGLAFSVFHYIVRITSSVTGLLSGKEAEE